MCRAYMGLVARYLVVLCVLDCAAIPYRNHICWWLVAGECIMEGVQEMQEEVEDL